MLLCVIFVTIADVICGRSVQKCRRKRNCSERLDEFGRSCSYLLEEGSSQCSPSCVSAVTRLMRHKAGKRVWFCRGHFRLWNKLRNAFNGNCSVSGQVNWHCGVGHHYIYVYELDNRIIDNCIIRQAVVLQLFFLTRFYCSYGHYYVVHCISESYCSKNL